MDIKDKTAIASKPVSGDQKLQCLPGQLDNVNSPQYWKESRTAYKGRMEGERNHAPGLEMHQVLKIQERSSQEM